jgi:hypothetical protein
LEEQLGTGISLDVGGVSLAYSKNHMGMDHGSLFQQQDRKPVPNDQILYGHYEPEEENRTEAEMAFTRRLKDVVPRLELLGFNLDRVRLEYEKVSEIWREERLSYLDEETRKPPDLMSFAEFRQLVTEHSLESLDSSFASDMSGERKDKVRSRFADVDVERIPTYESLDLLPYSERSFFGGLIDILHPYAVIRLLAEATANENVAVNWQFGPLVDAGWATRAEFVPNARRKETFLIATEGSSDVHILKHALSFFRPGIADFFRFIDVSESHPFSGTGNLVKFAEGLAKIDIHNQVLFLFDNDAEGYDAYERVSKLTLPMNMRTAILPELEEFRAFDAQGPDGLRKSDINRRAAAIECYLDLNVGGYPPAKVLWTNLKKTGVYQGSLEHKESYLKAFLDQSPESITDGSYNARKIEAVLDLLTADCTGIAFDQSEAIAAKLV